MDRLIEYKTKQNKDTDQILLLEDELISKDSILVMEDNFSTRIVLQKYLLSLGYKEILTAENGREGIAIFKDLVDSGKIVPILLDDSLPDYSAIEVVTKLLQIYCAAKIWVMSTKKTDHHDTALLINHGICGLINKPLRFDNIQNELKELERNTSSKDELKRVLKVHKVMSDSEMSEVVDDKELFSNIINELKSQGIIQKSNTINEMTCNKCDSVRIVPRFFCPVCGKTFNRSTLIEHHECGNVSETNTYKNDVCPKCHKKLKILGVDYRILENYYVCDSCKDKFPEPMETFECQKCGNRQKVHEGKWKLSDLYYINSIQ